MSGVKRFIKRIFAFIRVKTTFTLLVMLCVYILLTTAIYVRQLNADTHAQAEQAASQASDLLISGIRSELTSARNISNLLTQNSDVRAWLKESAPTGGSVARRDANAAITQFFINFRAVESIYVFNNASENINISNHLTRKTFVDILDANWYTRAVGLNGGAFISLNASDTMFNDAGNNISFIRQILDMQTLKPSGFLIINLNESFLSGLMGGDSNPAFYVLDENGQSIIRGQVPPESVGLISTDDGQEYVYKATIPELGWTVITGVPYKALGSAPFATRLFLISTLFAVGLYIIGSVYAGASMENEKRKAELAILSEQFKPHFLYNTLDSISYLILSGSARQAHDAVIALSVYYRIGLKKAAETVPLSDEIEMIKNYMALQKIRYTGMIEDIYDISPQAEETHILRNVLQPLLENSIYHGIRPSGEPGRIKTSASVADGFLYLTVEDDGIGIPRERLEQLRADIIERDPTSFGLRGMVKRIRLYYGRADVCRVESEEYRGTKVTLKIPLRYAEGGRRKKHWRIR